MKGGFREMKKIFKKISAIATSALMVGMTLGVAAAANYPSPFVSGGNSNVAIIYGTGTGVSSLDLVQAGNLQSNLQSYLAGSTGSSTSVSGEAVELYTGGTKIYISDGLNKVKTVLTKSDLPTILADGTFSGNVDAKYTQTIDVGAFPNVTYAKQPTSSDDPNLGLSLSTSTNSQALNLTVTFSKVVNMSQADSEGEDLVLFGVPYTVAAATDNTNLVLLKSAQKLSLASDAPTSDVTIGGKTYTVELISASDTSATIKVTDESGASEQKEINEAASKKINGVTIAVTTADENNLKYSASIVAGSQRVTFTDNSYVKVGEDDSAILGTDVDFGGGNPGALSRMTISVTADDSDRDALKAGQDIADPVFGTVKLSLAGFNIASDSAAREDIKVEPSGDNKMQITFTDKGGNTHTQRYALYSNVASAYGVGNNVSLIVDDNFHNMSVREGEKIHRDDYVVVGNEDDARLLRVSTVSKSVTAGTTASGDKLTFLDVFSGDSIEANLNTNTTKLSSGTVVIGGKSYTAYVEGVAGAVTDSNLYNVSLDYPDSAGTALSGNLILYPTIETSKGAKVAFYEPINNLPLCGGVTATNGCTATGFLNGAFAWNNYTNLTGLMFPNGADGYQTVSIAWNGTSTAVVFTCGTQTPALVGANVLAATLSCNLTNTGFGYNISYDSAATNTTSIRLNTAAGASIEEPAIMVFDEKDDNNVYEGMIITTESGASSDDGVGVNDVERTWTDDNLYDAISMASDSKKTQEMDLWGNIVTVDGSDSDQNRATISYPDEQVYALLSIGALSSSLGIVGGVSGAQLGEVLAKDTEVSSVSSKHLIVVGGSCINSVAANLVGAGCGSAWTTATGVGSGQFLIQSFTDKYTTGKIALLVAGYEAADTVNAATYLRTKAVDTAAGKKYIGTSATNAELVTTTA